MKRIIAILAVLGLVATLGGCATIQTEDGKDTTVENEARKSQAAKVGEILGLVREGKLRLSNEMTVAPADPSKPMVNVSVRVVQAADPQIMMALLKLCDMSHYESPATIADVLIAFIGAGKEVAIRGLDTLPWKWGFDALTDALSKRGYSVSTGNNGNVIIASTDTTAPQIGRDQNTGTTSGSDRDKDKSSSVTKNEGATE